MQYSERPSPLSLGKVHAAGVPNRLLWPRIFERIRAMQPRDRTKVVFFGGPLGALTSQNVLVGWGTLGLRALGMDRALWVGTPETSRWMHEVTGEPRPDVDKSLVAMANDYEEFCELGDQQKEQVRCVLLSHDNDGVTKFGPSLIDRRPGWLGPARPPEQAVPGRSPRGIPPSMRWRLVTTFYQSLVDMKNAQNPRGVPGVGPRLSSRPCRLHPRRVRPRLRTGTARAHQGRLPGTRGVPRGIFR